MHTVARPVLAVRLPHGDVASIGELGARSLALGVRSVGVDGFISEQRGGAINLRRHIDRHRARLAGTAIAITDADADGATADRRGRAVGIGQRFDHRFNRGSRGTGIELHHQVSTVQAAGDEGADDRAAIADGAAHRVAGGADLASTGARAANRKIVLCRHVIGQLRVSDVAEARDHADPEPAAVEVCGVAVGQPHARVDQLRGGVDQVLGEGCRRDDIDQHRRRRLAQRTTGAEKLVVDAVGVGRAAALQSVARPTDDEIRSSQAGDVGLVLRARHRGVGDHRSVDLVAAGIELLVNHILAAALERG